MSKKNINYAMSCTLVILITLFVWVLQIEPPNRCGVVKELSEERIIMKYDDGKYEKESVTFDTFYNASVGERLCFKGNHKDINLLYSLIIYSAIIINIVAFIIVNTEE